MRRREIGNLARISDERANVEAAEREGRAAILRRLRTGRERDASALNRFLRKRFRSGVRRRGNAGGRLTASRRRVVSFRIVGADRVRAGVVTGRVAAITVVSAIIVISVAGAGARGRVALFAATADEVAANVARVAVRFRRTRRATAVRVNSFGQHRGGPMEGRGRDVENAADERREVVTRIATEAAVTASGAVIRVASRRAGRRRNVAGRRASGGRNVADGSANGFASGSDRFANGGKFAVRGAGAAVISEITGLTERRRRA